MASSPLDPVGIHLLIFVGASPMLRLNAMFALCSLLSCLISSIEKSSIEVSVESVTSSFFFLLVAIKGPYLRKDHQMLRRSCLRHPRQVRRHRCSLPLNWYQVLHTSSPWLFRVRYLPHLHCSRPRGIDC